ncbi:MAG: TldD/PmbA family protein [Chloroflexi bacterium]|nr:TldD/PmbA family protein [Chloroflexota bacterium]
MERILERALKSCQQAEVFRLRRRETPVSFEANRLKMLETKESSGTALRVVKDGRIGFSATNNPDDVDGLVERAVELAEFGAEARFSLPGPAELADVAVYDEATERLTVEAMVGLGQRMIDDLLKANRDLVCEAGVTKSVGAVEIMNSNGGQAGYERSTFSMALHGTLIRGTDMLFVGDWASSCRPDLDPDAITQRVIRQLELAMETAEAPSGEMPVLFSPRGVASAFIGPLATALNGRTVLQGASPLQGKLGQQLLDQRISIWDDPTVPLRPGSRGVDDEGVPTRRTTLFDHGVPTAFLYDLQTAGQAGAESTGSGSRGLGSLPTPSTSVILVDVGETPNDDIIGGIDDGLLVEQLLGAGQGNVLGGEFGGNVLLGYRIKNGRIQGRVKNTMISGNVYDALNKIVAIGDTAEWVGGSLSTPPICCLGVTVSKKS